MEVKPGDSEARQKDRMKREEKATRPGSLVYQSGFVVAFSGHQSLTRYRVSVKMLGCLMSR